MKDDQYTQRTHQRMHIRAVMMADNTTPHMNVPTAIPATATTPHEHNLWLRTHCKINYFIVKVRRSRAKFVFQRSQKMYICTFHKIFKIALH